MEEIKFKIRNTEAANIEIVPCSDGVEIVVHYGQNKPSYTLHAEEPETTYKSKSKWAKKGFKSNEEIIEEMKEAAREEYKKEDCDKEELKKFVKFWEDKINENGWKGKTFNFETLYERWLSNKK